MLDLFPAFYLSVFLWALLLHGIWEYAQVIPLYQCWSRWTIWERLWILPAATIGDAIASVAFAAGAAALLGPSAVRPLSPAGGAFLFGTGLSAGLLFEILALKLNLWRYKEAMPTLRVAGHDLGLAPVLQMTALPALAVCIGG